MIGSALAVLKSGAASGAADRAGLVQQHVSRQLSESVRHDGRTLLQWRPHSVTQSGVTSSRASHGTALPIAESTARIGLSFAHCVVSVVAAPPLPETPDAGRVEFSVSLSPTTGIATSAAAPAAAAHAQIADVVQLQQTLSLFLQQAFAGAVDLHSLCIRVGEVVWMLRVSITLMELDGAPWDLAVAAATSALGSSITIPVCTLADGSSTEEIRLGFAPTNCRTMIVAGTKLLVCDPTEAELLSADAVIAVALREAGAGFEVCAIEHAGRLPVGRAVLREALAIAQTR